MRLGACALLCVLLTGLSQADARDRAAQAGDLPIVFGDKGNCPRPHYPEQARTRKQEGTVQLRYLLASDGRVKQTIVSASSGHPALDEAARDAVSACRFAPALAEGKQVQRWADIRYVFKLSAKDSSGTSGAVIFGMMAPAIVMLGVARRRRQDGGSPAAKGA